MQSDGGVTTFYNSSKPEEEQVQVICFSSKVMVKLITTEKLTQNDGLRFPEDMVKCYATFAKLE